VATQRFDNRPAAITTTIAVGRFLARGDALDATGQSDIHWILINGHRILL
jgi:hypothetical protein